MVAFTNQPTPSEQKPPTYLWLLSDSFFVKLSDQRSDIFVCELGGKIIEWQSHISVRTLNSHFHYLNGPIMWELKLLRYTSLCFTKLSSLSLISPMNAMDVFCLIMIVLSSQPQQPPVFEHGPLMYSFLRQH